MEYPMYTSGTAIFSSDPKNFVCYICPEKFQQSVEEHLVEERHKLRLSFFLRYFKEYGNFNFCGTCRKWLLLNEIIDHAKFHKFFPWCNLDENLEVPIQENKALACDIKPVKSTQLSFKDQQSTEPENSSGNKSDIISICKICKAKVNINDIQTHLNFHQDLMSQVDKQTNSQADLTAIKANIEIIGQSLIDLTLEHDDEGMATANQESHDISIKSHDLLANEVTSKNKASELNSQLNKSKITGNTNSTSLNVNQNSSNDLNLPDAITKKDDNLYCELCKVIAGNSYQCAIDDVKGRHERRCQAIGNGIIRIRNEEFKCTFCCCILISSDDVKKHLTTVKHIKNFETSSVGVNVCATAISKTNNDLPDGVTRKGETFYCEPCDVDFFLYQTSIDHAKSISHKNQVLFPEGIISVDKILHKCIFCNSIFKKFPDVEDHLKSVEHQVNFRLKAKNIISSTISIHEINRIPNESDLPDGYKRRCNTIFCMFCQDEVGTYDNIIEHSNSKQHKLYNNSFKMGISRLSNEKSNCSFCNCTLVGWNAVEQHLENVEHKRNSRQATLSRELKTKSDSGSNEKLNDDLPDGFVKKGPAFFCESCNVQFLILRSAIGHANSIQHKTHRDAFQKGVIRVDGKLHMCTVCKCKIDGLNRVMKHLQSDNHQKKSGADINIEKSTLTTTFSKRTKSDVSLMSSLSSPGTLYSAPSFPTNRAPSRRKISSTNRKGKGAINKKASTLTGQPLMKGSQVVTSPIEVAFIQCNVCNWVFLSNSINIIRHTTSEEHIFKLQAVRLILNTIDISMEPIMSYVNHARYFQIEFNIESDMNLSKILMIPLIYTCNARQCLFYWCNICDSMFYDAPNAHLRNIQHLQIIHGIRTSLVSPYLICRMCNNATFISFGGVMDHINRPVHQRNLVGEPQPRIKGSKISPQSIESIFAQKNLPDGIESMDNALFLCTICNYRIHGLNTIGKHVNDTFHKARGKTFIVRMRKPFFACLICSNLLPNLESLEPHLSIQTHREKWKAINKRDPRHFVTTLLRPIKMYEQNEYHCSICNIWIEGDMILALEHTLHKVHQITLLNRNMERTPEVNALEIAKKSSEMSPPHKIVTESCVSAPQFISAFKNTKDATPFAFSNINEIEPVPFIRPSNNTQSVCNICNVIIVGGDRNLMVHRDCKQHKENEAKLNTSLLSASPETKLKTQTHRPPLLKNIPHEEMMQIQFNGTTIDSIECKVCKVHIREAEGISAHHNYVEHMKSREHEAKEVEFIENWKPAASSSQRAFNKSSGNQKSSTKMDKPIKIANKQILSCSLCTKKIEFTSQLQAHETNHFWPRFVMSSGTKIPDDFESLNIPNQNLQEQIDISEDLNDIEFIGKPDESRNTQQAQNWRRRSLDIGIGDDLNIYEVNKQKKEDLHLGMLLTFPVDTENFYCLVCREMLKNSVQIFYEHLCSINHLDYLQQIIKDHQEFKDYPGELSDFALSSEYIEEIDDLLVKCHACGYSLQNDTVSLNKHINDISHVEHCAYLIENARIWFDVLSSRMHCDFYSVKNYWCVPCRLKFSVEIEFRRHLLDTNHLKQIKRFKDIDEELIFDYCAVCGALWLGFLKTFGYHVSCAMHKHYATQPFFLVSRLPVAAELLLQFPEFKINKFLEKIDSLQEENTQKEKRLLSDLEFLCKQKYPNCVVYPFGSRVSGLGGISSDLDVFIDCTNKYSVYEGQNSSAARIEERLKIIKKCLEKNSRVWLIDREILHARIPIIKVTHRPTKIQCDISFTNGLTVENTKLIKRYCEKFSNCRKMIMFIKNYMSHCELTGLYGLNSYGIVWMVIFFLQMKGILPPVHELIVKNKYSRLIDGWETGVNLNFEATKIGERIEKLLAEFFQFYANFDYRCEIICPLLGKSIPKIDFQKKSNLPTEMKSYIRYLEKNRDAEPFRIDSILCIQDPFDLSHNVTKAVKKTIVYRLKSFCSLSTQILSKY